MDQLSKENKLIEMHKIVREELSYRRSRQQQIFTWSSAILVAIIAAMLISNSNSLVITIQGKLIAIILVTMISLVSSNWQMKQRKLLTDLQIVVTRIMKELGYFSLSQTSDNKSVLPSSWENWGQNYSSLKSQLKINHPTKILVTIMLGIAAIFAILLR